MQNVLAKLQKLGKALMLPIASLPIAGILLRIGQADLLNIPFFANAGAALFDNLPLLFAIGIAVGLAKDSNGAAGLAGAIAYFILNKGGQAVNDILQMGTIFGFAPEDVTAKLGEGVALTTINMAHLGGILAGVIAGLCYNKFKDTKLPDWLQFFGGRRFVPIVTAGVTLVVSIPMGLIWPFLQKGLNGAGIWMTESGGIGAFLYGFANRLLLPFGLHHVVNSAVWFNFGEYTDAAGKVWSGDLWRFFGGDPTGGTFTAGFFPIMMFALPAAAVAMYVCAKKENKAVVGGALFSVALTAFFCGVTEPIEFMFMFLAPVLFVLHAALTGLSLVVCQLLGIRDSFTFSAGFLDYALNFGIAAKPLLLLVVGVAFAAVYFFLFVFFIKKFDLKTPGREDDSETESFSKLVDDQGFDAMASQYIATLGGKENIKEIEACITRIRLVLVSNKELDEKAFKALGASGVMKAGTQVTQIIVGTKAELLVDAMKKFL